MQNLLLHLPALRMLDLNYLLALLDDLDVIVAAVVPARLRATGLDGSTGWVLIQHELLVLSLIRRDDLLHRLTSKLLLLLVLCGWCLYLLLNIP